MSRQTEQITTSLREHFKVTCAKCGSDNVKLHDSMGYSDYTGSWGSIDLICHNPGCDNCHEVSGG